MVLNCRRTRTGVIREPPVATKDSEKRRGESKMDNRSEANGDDKRIFVII
jgi:hypothetical protein